MDTFLNVFHTLSVVVTFPLGITFSAILAWNICSKDFCNLLLIINHKSNPREKKMDVPALASGGVSHLLTLALSTQCLQGQTICVHNMHVYVLQFHYAWLALNSACLLHFGWRTSCTSGLSSPTFHARTESDGSFANNLPHDGLNGVEIGALHARLPGTFF